MSADKNKPPINNHIKDEENELIDEFNEKAALQEYIDNDIVDEKEALIQENSLNELLTDTPPPSNT
ncbi:hypothetical protein BJ944DRAFT_242894, partial [Cunninghamella echinulata]